ncbi:LysE family translocator [Sinimarinibacterium sp. CAU 1509]|uniref:LysE family translocator n=1 Tax=Sinimarinibacterium sp. CAU 1509 TaxID=2562283 RepID=UPI001B7F7AA5|nr:LysE family translocator [Sinimarinibacterium sp. CAU 1509]
MSAWLPAPTQWAAFVAASVVLAVTPGPGVLYIVTRSLTQGRSAGLASVAGVALGNFGNATFAALGLATVLALSAELFTAIKWLGAAYLIVLGLRALRRPTVGNELRQPPATSLRRIFVDGFWVALLNPKTALFFAAFLPQFMSTDAEPVAQSLLLGAVFVGIAATSDSLYALGAGHLGARWLRRNPLQSLGRYAVCLVYVGLGLLTAFGAQRAPSR